MRLFLLIALIYSNASTGHFMFFHNSSISIKYSDTTHFIGEQFGGGVVFYLSEDKKHGLIAAPESQITSMNWNNGKMTTTGVTEEAGFYKGAENTEKLIKILQADDPNGKFAAKICADYSIMVNGKTYDDWFLPSKKELFLLYLNYQKVGGFENKYYFWSSNEAKEDEAWLINLYDGKFLNVNKEHDNYVRAIRSF